MQRRSAADGMVTPSIIDALRPRQYSSRSGGKPPGEATLASSRCLCQRDADLNEAGRCCLGPAVVRMIAHVWTAVSKPPTDHSSDRWRAYALSD